MCACKLALAHADPPPLLVEAVDSHALARERTEPAAKPTDLPPSPPFGGAADLSAISGGRGDRRRWPPSPEAIGGARFIEVR